MSSGESILKKFGLGVVGLTAGLTFLIGLGMLVSAYHSAPDVELMSQMGAFRDVKSDRAPSSVPKTLSSYIEVGQASEVKSLGRIESLNLGCLKADQSLRFKSGARHIRMSAGLCATLAIDLTESTLVNVDTGREATLFYLLSDKKVTTDYLSLQKGENKFSLLMADQSGGKTKTEIIVSSD